MSPYIHRMAIAVMSAAGFWYWMVLPMPPPHDPGLSYENVWQWIGALWLLGCLSGLLDRRPFVATSCVALGHPLAFIPYDLFGYADRPSPIAFRVDHLAHPIVFILYPFVLALYFSTGFSIAVLPTFVTWWLKERLRARRRLA